MKTSVELRSATPNTKHFLSGIFRSSTPVNLAYEAATADLSDVNMIDPYHMDAYGRMAVNYNRDIEVFPVLDAIFHKISGSVSTVLPTDMGVNMAGNCICDDDVVCEASRDEIIRRYFATISDSRKGRVSARSVKLELLCRRQRGFLLMTVRSSARR